MIKNLIFLLAICVLTSQFTWAQDPSSFTNLSTVDVDDLSDDQIKQYLERAQSSGFTEQQLLILAKQRGMTDVQIQKLRTRIAGLGISTSGTVDDGDPISRIREENLSLPISDFGDEIFGDLIQIDSIALLEEMLAEKELKIFGSELFNNSEINFEPSLNTPTPKNYLIGPGDEMIIDVWGASEQSYNLVVSPEGSIKISNLGPIYVNGMTVESATRKVKNRLSKIYSGLYARDGQSADTFFQLSLGSIRSVKVNVIGEVNNPGTYTLSSFSTVFNALYYAGGPNENGSMRLIQHIRNNKVIGTLDVYAYLIDGKLTTANKLEDEDVILVKPYTNRLTITGEVKRPALYEGNDEDSFLKAVEYAGGFTENAYQSSIQIKRKNKREQQILTVGIEDLEKAKVQNGDAIFVNKILDRFTNRVSIEGAVNLPGEYELTEGLTAKKLIELAGGIRPDAFTNRALIIRLNEDLTAYNLTLPLGKLINGGVEDVPLQREDVIRISSIFDIAEAKTLTIKGEVLNEGEFSFIDNMTVEDLIILAGGLTEAATEKTVEVARRAAKTENVGEVVSETFEFNIDFHNGVSEASDFILMPFDIVTVRRSPGYTEQITVEVEGEVKYPGTYALKLRDERISDLLIRAGGITKFGYAKGAQLIRRTEFYDPEEAETSTAIEQKKESLEAFQESDSLVDQLEIKQFETVGIDLEKIIKNPRSNYDLRLLEGDVLSIPRQLETVRVNGEILYPITIKYGDQLSFKDYINASGGTNDQARIGKSFVIYPNGTAAQTKRFLWFKNYPDIQPGSEIVVPRRPARSRISIQEVLAITTSLTTIALLIDRLGN